MLIGTDCGLITKSVRIVYIGFGSIVKYGPTDKLNTAHQQY